MIKKSLNTDKEVPYCGLGDLPSSGKHFAGSSLGVQANWPILFGGGMYHGWLPQVLSLVAGCGLLW